MSRLGNVKLWTALTGFVLLLMSYYRQLYNFTGNYSYDTEAGKIYRTSYYFMDTLVPNNTESKTKGAIVVSSSSGYKQHSFEHASNDHGRIGNILDGQALKNFHSSPSSPVRTSRNIGQVCEKREVRLSDHPLPLTGLVSFPGSGNTWVRHLLQQLTGIATSSVYCDHGLEKRGFKYECTKQRNRTIVIKSHNIGDIPRFARIILIVRNPYEAFLAYMNYRSAGHTGIASDKLIQSKISRLPWYQKWYKGLIQKVVEFSDTPVHVLHYEMLKVNMEEELKGLARFLNVGVTDGEIYCTEKLQEGLYHRKSTYDQRVNALKKIFTPELMNTMVPTVEYCQQLLEERFHRKYDVGWNIQTALIESLKNVDNSGILITATTGHNVDSESYDLFHNQKSYDAGRHNDTLERRNSVNDLTNGMDTAVAGKDIHKMLK